MAAYNFDSIMQISAGRTEAPKKPPELSPEPLLGSEGTKPLPERKKPLQSKYREIPIDAGGKLYKIERAEPDQTGINKLQRQADQAQSERERAAAAYKKYQENIAAAGTIISDITKGLNAGRDIHDLFLLAIQAIANMTNDNVLRSHAESTLKTIYGVALGEYRPLQIEYEDATERLEKLQEAVLWAEGNDRQRIQNAIKWHEQYVAELQEKIDRTAPK